MASDLPFSLNRVQSEGFVKYFEAIRAVTDSFIDYRSTMEEIDVSYQRESDTSDETIQERLAKLRGDVTKVRNVEIPLVKPQVESGVTYLSSVFLTGYPIFGVTSGPRNIDIALQWNSLMAEHARKGQWVRNLQMFFRDGIKYNLHGLHVHWDKSTVFQPETTAGKKQAERREVVWEGNKIQRLDMYNTFFDVRVPIADIHTTGEYVGFHELISRIELKKLVHRLAVTTNIASAYSSAFDNSLYYTPAINRFMFHDKAEDATRMNWDNWFAGLTGQKKISWAAAYVLTTLYCRIIPADFQIYGNAKLTPQIWKLYFINGRYPIYAERLNNLHDYFPVILGQPFEDGLGLQTKSLAMDVMPFQDVSSALWSSRIHAARRRISDRIIYNEKVIRRSDIEKPEASAKIPARLPAYNADLRANVMHLPFEDAASATFSQEISSLAEFSFYASGQNRVQQGQFQKGNKTLEEFNTVMQNANGRNQSIALFIEDQIFTPLKHILKYNIIQYQAAAKIYNREEDKTVEIKPEQLRELDIEFKVSDGLIPASKMMSTEEFAVALQVIGSSPQLMQEYQISSLFSYLFKLRGVDGLDIFKKSKAELLYQQQLASWQQVAMEAMKQGQQPPPQPQPPAELQQAAQEEQMNAGT